MPKRKPQSESYPEYDGLTLDDLYGERASVGRQMHAVGKSYQELRMPNDFLTRRIRQVTSGETGIGISDHAVLRYLERVKGVDMRAVRDEIRQRVSQQRMERHRDQIVKDGETSCAIYDGERVSTVWTEADPKPATTPIRSENGTSFSTA